MWKDGLSGERAILHSCYETSLELSESLVGDIEQFIDEQAARKIREKEYGGRAFSSVLEYRALRRRRGKDRRDGSGLTAGIPENRDRSLEDMISDAGETFQQKLFKLIDESGMDDVTVYKKANIDRKVFSRIRCKPDYKPKKKTAVAFAIALELDMPTMLDLLSRAEIAFSPSNKFDLIVTYFITHRIYDIYEINLALFRYGQPVLGE